MHALANPPSQRVVAEGDTLRLEFVGPGQHGDPQDFEVTSNPGNPHCWSSALLGRRSGETVDLPDKEGNVVHALIREINRQ